MLPSSSVRTLLTSISLLVITTSVCIAQEWERLATDYRAAHYIDSTTIVAVGDHGIIVRSSDGGEHWKRQSSGTRAHLTGVHFFDRYSGLAIGDSGIVLSTFDAGTTWNRQTTAEGADLTGMTTYENVVVVVGEHGKIVRSNDLGSSWQQVLADTTYTLSAVDCSDRVWIAVGWSGLILRSTDAGLTWSTQESGVTEYLGDVSFGSARDVVAVGNEALTLRSTDGGVTWTRSLEPGVTTSFRSIHMFNAVDGIAAGFDIAGRMIARTSNGGITWAYSDDGNPHHFMAAINDLAFVDRERGFAVGTWGCISRTADGGANWDTVSFAPLEFPYLGDFRVYDFAFASVDTLVAGGDGVLRSTDGGATWKYRHTKSAGTLRDIHFFDRTTGFAAGSIGRTLEWTTDAGLTWIMRTFEIDGDVYGQQFPDVVTSEFFDDAGYLAAGNRILRAHDPGTWSKWSQIEVPDATFILSIEFPTRARGFIATVSLPSFGEYFSGVMRSSDSGATWVSVLTREGSQQNIDGVVFRDSVNGFAYGGSDRASSSYLTYHPKLLRTTNAGESWDSIEIEGRGQIRDIKFFNEQLGYGVGDNALIIVTTDGGVTWQRELPWPPRESDTVELFESIELSPDGRTVMIGGDGIILRKVFPSRVTNVEENQRDGAVASHAISVFPNPVGKNDRDVMLRMDGARGGVVTVHGLLGESFDVPPVAINLTHDGAEARVDVSGLIDGMYIVRWSVADRVASTIIVVAR